MATSRDDEKLTKVHLIEKGVDVIVERSSLFPAASESKVNADRVCPVLVVDAGEEQRKIAAEFIGRTSRCINGLDFCNLVVIPSVGICVKGRLLVSSGPDKYVELKDIKTVQVNGEEKPIEKSV
ncbi:unnamed protein product [Gongylonema pulchrum]|uniref:Ribose-5-phosphate isomerase n=1 Tax=Gongylonema pulchrum TaxID=637853 RepID=A0A183EJ01_9BILA|nr:unnamed protein product [Gongylonema pulchrum]